MKLRKGIITLTPSDLSAHLGCRHLTQLEIKHINQEIDKPFRNDPSLELLRERGEEHEKAYVSFLKSSGKNVIEFPIGTPFEETVKAMKDGYDVIVQAPLGDGRWTGRADILVRVDKPSKNLGSWSYEVQDTKLAQDTKAGTVLQLCLYSEIVAKIQGDDPEIMYVIKPDEFVNPEKFRYHDFSAYFRQVKSSLIKSVEETPATYPDPTDHCHVCNWWETCRNKRKADDHLSLIAGIRRMHIGELNKLEVTRLEDFALRDQPLDNKPERGSLQTFHNIHRQAKIQYKGRLTGLKEKEFRDFNLETGLNRLMEPDAGDLYFDLEGDRFYEDGGLEYLFGVVYKSDKGDFVYEHRWAENPEEEKAAFDWFIQFVMDRWSRFPGMHIYHYNHYEPSALKRLMLRYGMHLENVDRLLRGERFIDLLVVSREAIFASVERYSLKDLELFAGFERSVPLINAGPARRAMEYVLESKNTSLLDPQIKETVRGYNEDDCRATHALHVWLETLRDQQIANGFQVTRGIPNEGLPSKEQSDAELKRQELVSYLIEGIPADENHRSEEQKAKWLLAHMIHYFQREDKNVFWEFYRRMELEYTDLFDEKEAIANLEFEEIMPGTDKQSLRRYRFPHQELSSIKDGAEVHELAAQQIGTLYELNRAERWIIINHKQETADLRPKAIVFKSMIRKTTLEQSIMRFAYHVLDEGFTGRQFRPLKDLLMKRSPRVGQENGEALLSTDEDIVAGATRLASALDHSVLPIQGPPGTGKSYTAAHMILDLYKKGKRIGITAVSHKVIIKLLEKVAELGADENITVNLGHKADHNPDHIKKITDAKSAMKHFDKRFLIGGTAWLWANKDLEDSVDYLFIDEAGQMSLAQVVAAGRCAKNLIMLGDPGQLEQPQQAVHPEGADVSALAHLLGANKTIPPDKGIFIGTTRRLHPSIKRFTSEIFYEGRLDCISGLENQAILGAQNFRRQGLNYVAVEHNDCQSYCEPEITRIKELVSELLAPGVRVKDEQGRERPITAKDILIVAPYNLQVDALKVALPELSVGTVDKFQGQEAPIVIYSMTSSSAEDVPRGMSFLFDPNRLNVATSRARCICLIVASPRLFEPECRSVEQMRWVNAFCRYKEMATCNLNG